MIKLNKILFQVARLAKWLPTDECELPMTMHAGVGLVRTEVVKVIDLLDKAKTRCKTALVKEGIPDIVQSFIYFLYVCE